MFKNVPTSLLNLLFSFRVNSLLKSLKKFAVKLYELFDSSNCSDFVFV